MNARPDLIQKFIRNQMRALGAAGLRMHLPGLWHCWPWLSGCEVLILWSGERLPYPRLDWVDGERQAVIAALTVGGQTTVDTFDDLVWADGVHHFALVRFSAGGAETEINPIEIATRVRDGGTWLGLMPNAPGCPGARLLSGNRPLVTWSYSMAGEQTTPASFGVYATTPPTPFNFAAPIATVARVEDQRRYSWTGAGLSGGDIRCYTVRAISSGGVKSLIPRVDRPPSGDYNAVELVRCPRIEVGAAATADPGRVDVEARA